MAVSEHREPNRQSTLTTDPRELRLTLVNSPVSTILSLPGLIDVGEAGRLLGLEVDFSAAADVLEHLAGDHLPKICEVDDNRLYVSIMADEGDQSRSARVTLRVGLDQNRRPVELVIPRRGEGYEITYPSGNR
jgi:hypothetical protein